MMSLHCLLAYVGSDKKSTEILIFVLLYVMCLFFSWVALHAFSLFLFQQFGYDVSRCFLSVSLTLISLFGCARPQLWYVESSIFIITCKIFSWHVNS